jgi:tetratricopeptide (TPR) repeat protein
MNCARVAREEVAENYLLGRLSDEDRDAFERHFFECDRCLDDLRLLQAIQRELPRVDDDRETTMAHPWIQWATLVGVAATIVLAVGVVLWMRPLLPPAVPEPSDRQLPSQAAIPEAPRLQTPESTIAAGPSLEQLARVEAPSYQPLTLRGVQDEAMARFQAGMSRYGEADYRAAVPELRAAAKLSPDAAHIRFFLGISHLMAGQDIAAIDELRATIALGDSPYLEEAHWYLAKALLRQKDLVAAEAELETLIELQGTGTSEAGRLLTEIQRLKEP